MRALLYVFLITAVMSLVLVTKATAQDRRVFRERPNARPVRALIEDCAACHSFTRDRIVVHGPSLYGLYGRPVASDPDFVYSERLATRGGVWDQSTLMGFLERPEFFAGQTRMHFRGIASFEERRRIITWLAEQREKADNGGPPSLQAILDRGRADEGGRKARACSRCHAMKPQAVMASVRGYRGPSLVGLVGRQVASEEGYPYRANGYDAGALWTRERLNRFLMAPTKFDYGAHPSFRRLTHAQDRADLIAYLATLSPGAQKTGNGGAVARDRDR